MLSRSNVDSGVVRLTIDVLANKFFNEMEKGKYVSIKGIRDYLKFEHIHGTQHLTDEWILLLVTATKAFKEQRLIIRSALLDLNDMIIVECVK